MKEGLQRALEIIDEAKNNNPLKCNFEEDGRYTYPQRFSDIIGIIQSEISMIESVPVEKLVMPTLTGDLENDLQIIYKNGKPYGIRDRSGYLLFFTNISHYTGQDKRYQEEIDQQNELAEYLLKQLSKCSA